MTTTTTYIFLKPRETKSPIPREDWDMFDRWFSRCYKTLYFIAYRILVDSEMAVCAVQNCRLKASRNLRCFESEGAFRSWILRLLIGEALSILHPDHREAFEKTRSFLEFRQK
jgi:DNA-directed RNA polymerase specialized sigma24 family protein